MHRYARRVKYSFFFFLTFIGKPLRSQQRALDPQSDTAYWYQEKKADARLIGLRDLTTTSDSLHFRYWLENQAVDIWTNDTTEPLDRYYSDKRDLTPLQAKQVYQLFDQVHLFSLSSDKDIKGWTQGNDGEELLLEISTGRSYSFKSYWTPSAQKNVPEAAVLVKLNRRLNSLLNLEANWDKFISSLPKGCYSYGEMQIICTNIKIKSK